MRILLVLLAFSTISAPLQAALSREALAAAGLLRKEAASTVYWAGEGKRPLLVLLHGVNEDATTWGAVAAPLSRHFRLVIPDLPGHGESAPREGAITYQAMLDGIAAVIAAEAGEETVTLAGNSMGGWLAMLYTFEHPSRVSRLVLENASGMAWMPSDAPLFPKTREDAARTLRAVHGPGADVSEPVLDAFLARKNTPLSRISMQDALSRLVDRRLGELSLPVTLIWGRHDGLLPVAYAQALQKKIAGSTLSIIEDAAHIPHRQQPEKFVQCLTATC